MPRSRSSDSVHTPSLDLDAVTQILQVHLLIARAAQKDSLAWWDDEALTKAGGFVLERLFPAVPREIALKLALASAQARHRAAFAEDRNVIHLFALDTNGAVSAAIEEISPGAFEAQTDPITTMILFRERLQALLGEPPVKLSQRQEMSGYRLWLHLKGDPLALSPLERARILSWGYLHAKLGEPVFPFLKYE